jgi:hypothetical protein
VFPPRHSTARKAIARRLRTGLALSAAGVAIAGAAAGAPSAMAATPVGCLQFPAGQLCADDDVGYPGYVLATACFSDGSHLSIYMATDTWNRLVNASATVSVPAGSPYGMSNLDYVLNHPPSSGSGGGGVLSQANLTADVLGRAGLINDITPAGTTPAYDPQSGTTGTLVDGHLTPTP